MHWRMCAFESAGIWKTKIQKLPDVRDTFDIYKLLLKFLIVKGQIIA